MNLAKHTTNISAFPVAPPDFFKCIVCGHASNSPNGFVMRQAKTPGAYTMYCYAHKDEPFPRWKFPALIKQDIHLVQPAAEPPKEGSDYE